MRLELHPEAAKNFNLKVEQLRRRLMEDPYGKKQHTGGGFIPDIVMTEVREQDVISFSADGYVDFLGREIAKTFRNGNSILGLFGDDYKTLVQLAEKIQAVKGIRDHVSVRFLVDHIFKWIIITHKQCNAGSMTEFVLAEAASAIREMELWLPVAMLHIESDIQIGKITLKTITREMLDVYHSSVLDEIGQHEGAAAVTPEIQQHLRNERRELQGVAAATIRVHAEPRRATEIAFEEADKSLAILRFFSLANLEPELVSYCTLLGREHVDETRTYEVRGSRFTAYSRAAVNLGSPAWTLDTATIEELLNRRGLGVLNVYLHKEDRTQYEEALIESLSLYSKCALAKNPSDKLVLILVAIESLLLRNNNEPIQQNLAERIAFLFPPEERIEIKKSVIRAYGLRSSFVHHGHSVSSEELHDLHRFMVNVWAAFHGLIGLAKSFNTKDQLFDKIEQLKMSGGSLS